MEKFKLICGSRTLDLTRDEILEPGRHYSTLCMEPSDINEHLPTLKEYAEKCDSVTEMGVRFACATWAFLEAKPKSLTCIDIRRDFFEPSEEFIKTIAVDYGIDFEFIESDSLKIEIKETDLLFIDTLHTYNQLISELKMHQSKVKKYIILHDTVTFGLSDEQIYGHASDVIKSMTSTKVGLVNAVNEFLSEFGEWKVKQHFNNNNGLTVLERLSKLDD